MQQRKGKEIIQDIPLDNPPDDIKQQVCYFFLLDMQPTVD